MARSLITGHPWRVILLFSVPLLIGNVVQQLYQFVDAIVVGRQLGVDALAAVGATGSLLFLLLGFAWGMTTGFAIPTAQAFGALPRLVGDQHTEVQFRHGDCADRELTLERADVRCQYDAGVQDRSHSGAHGSRRSSAMRPRSAAQSGSATPENRSLISAHCRQARVVAGTSSAAGRPATVTLRDSPASTRRMSSDAFCRNSRSPTASTIST